MLWPSIRRGLAYGEASMISLLHGQFHPEELSIVHVCNRQNTHILYYVCTVAMYDKVKCFGRITWKLMADIGEGGMGISPPYIFCSLRPSNYLKT